MKTQDADMKVDLAELEKDVAAQGLGDRFLSVRAIAKAASPSLTQELV